MDKKEEINKNLTLLANKFSEKVVEHFSELGHSIKLEKLEFSIEDDEKENKIIKDLNESSFRCHKNADGQWVCS